MESISQTFQPLNLIVLFHLKEKVYVLRVDNRADVLMPKLSANDFVYSIPPTLGPSFMFSVSIACVQRPLGCFGLAHLALLLGQHFLEFVFLMVQRCITSGDT